MSFPATGATSTEIRDGSLAEAAELGYRWCGGTCGTALANEEFRAADQASNINSSNYDMAVVIFRPNPPEFGWSGLGIVGTPFTWAKYTDKGVHPALLEHEIGHNYGEQSAVWDMGFPIRFEAKSASTPPSGKVILAWLLEDLCWRKCHRRVTTKTAISVLVTSTGSLALRDCICHSCPLLHGPSVQSHCTRSTVASVVLKSFSRLVAGASFAGCSACQTSWSGSLNAFDRPDVIPGQEPTPYFTAKIQIVTENTEVLYVGYRSSEPATRRGLTVQYCRRGFSGDAGMSG
eukprot:3937441-Rhodomonas_salina.1